LTLTPSSSRKHDDDASFSLVADFKQTPAIMPVLAAGQVETAAMPPEYALYVALDQVFNFTLSAAGTGAPAGSTVQMTITDATGKVVYTLTDPSGQTVTGPSVLLSPGAYTVLFSILTPAGAPGSLTFQLRGGSITDPIGPVITNPTYTPMYTYPGNPFVYYYPIPPSSMMPPVIPSVLPFLIIAFGV
jgi:hypothetical protein